MPQFRSPGVYVLEKPSGLAPVAGVGTSTAAFVGVLPNSWSLPEATQLLGHGDGARTTFALGQPVDRASLKVYQDGIEIAGSSVGDDPRVTLTLLTAPPAGTRVTASYRPPDFQVKKEDGEPAACTSWAEYTRDFGDFPNVHDEAQSWLHHAVYGFFANGGTRCWVARVAPPASSQPVNLRQALAALEAIDEVALVAAPGLTGMGTTQASVRADILEHCLRTQDRFALFDAPRDLDNDDLSTLGKDGKAMPTSSDYAALYFPWLKAPDTTRGREIWVPPSGHMAGVYARVDTTRGVHKAPANERVEGITALRYRVGRAQQESLNPHGVNVIRDINGAFRVWGARTLGGDINGEWRYVNVRRLFLYLRESIDESLQWTVFEPNTPSLWARIRLTVSAFLTNVWRDGGLFGTSPEDAFFVRCDETTNPSEVRQEGRVVTVIGVKVASPAEFVVFEISQTAQGGG
jgi:uncharacterized protein